MIVDKTLEFSNQQVPTVLTGNTYSTNVVDLGTPGTVLGGPAALTRDIGPGEPIPILVQISDAFATNQPGTITVQVLTDSTTTMATATVLAQTDALVASSLAAGYQIAISILPDKITGRYLALNYKIANTVTGGHITAAIVAGVQKNTAAGRA